MFSVYTQFLNRDFDITDGDDPVGRRHGTLTYYRLVWWRVRSFQGSDVSTSGVKISRTLKRRLNPKAQEQGGVE